MTDSLPQPQSSYFKSKPFGSHTQNATGENRMRDPSDGERLSFDSLRQSGSLRTNSYNDSVDVGGSRQSRMSSPVRTAINLSSGEQEGSRSFQTPKTPFNSVRTSELGGSKDLTVSSLLNSLPSTDSFGSSLSGSPVRRSSGNTLPGRSLPFGSLPGGSSLPTPNGTLMSAQQASYIQQSPLASNKTPFNTPELSGTSTSLADPPKLEENVFVRPGSSVSSAAGRSSFNSPLRGSRSSFNSPLRFGGSAQPVVSKSSTSLLNPSDRLDVKPIGSNGHSSFAEAIRGGPEGRLQKQSYLIMETITVAGTDEKYVKAFNPFGDYCFVDISGTEGISIQIGNQTSVEVTDGSRRVSASTQISAAQCAKMSTCGVMFECDGEFCSAKFDDSGSVATRSYTVTSQKNHSRITPYGSPIAFPIVTLAEIEANPMETISRTREATYEMQRMAIEEATKRTEALAERTLQLSKGMRHLHDVYSGVQSQRMKEINETINMVITSRQKNQLVSGEPLPPDEQRKFKAGVDHIRALNVSFVEHLNFMNSYNRSEADIAKINDFTQDSYWILYANVTRKDGVFFEDYSKNILSAAYWGLPQEVDGMNIDDAIVKLRENPDNFQFYEQLERIQAIHHLSKN
jgi:hypothetical protein